LRLSRAGRAALLACALSLAACGSDGEERSSAFDPFTEVPREPSGAAAAARRAAPRWEPIATLSGSGPASRPITIARRAIQWRARWRCQTGRLQLATVASAGDRTLARADECPRRGTSTSVRTGALRLAVKASGPWRIALEQQVDTALHEPPLAAMRSPQARVLARGRFYELERTGRGSALLYRLPGGRLALRLAGGFATAANTDLFVWLSTSPKPRNTVQAARTKHTVLRGLKSTLGEQNYLLPAGSSASAVRSIVIWCEPVRIAYTAAALRPR